MTETWQFSGVEIAVLLKAPRLGAVKTRLQPSLGPWRARALYRQLAHGVLRDFAAWRLAPVLLWAATPHPWFEALAGRYGFGLARQPEGDLGARMELAVTAGLERGRAVLLLGGDCPFLDRAHLSAALSALGRGEPVLAPARDGGYVGLGLPRAAPSLFRDMPWGDARVAALTRARLEALGWSWLELPERDDIDRPEDLPLLRGTSLSGFGNG